MLKRTGQLDSSHRNQLEANALRQIVFEGIKEALGPNEPYCGFTNEEMHHYFQPPMQQPTKDIESPHSASKVASSATDFHSAFAAMSTNAMDNRLKAFEERMLRLMQQQFSKSNNPNSGRGGGEDIQQNRVGHTKYCWTHGLYNHTSNECRNKKEGHQDNATFKNRMNGSNKGIKNE